MKKKIRVKFDSLKRGDCFRLTLKGPIYMKDDSDECAVAVTGRKVGHVIVLFDSRSVYQTNVNIVEEK